MVKSRRNQSNRRKPSRVNSKVDRISTGVPRTLRNIPTDPRTLPHCSLYPTVVRFVYLVMPSTVTGYSVSLGTSPRSPNTLQYAFTPTGAINVAPSASLTFNEIFYAASMRTFGVNVAGQQTSDNYMFTEFAIQKVLHYGSDNEQALSRDINLGVDFGDDIPGFFGRDAGNRKSRPVVGCSPPRLAWRKIIANDNRVCVQVGQNLGIPEFLNAFRANGSLQPAASTAYDIGILDITVLVRRSFVSLANTAYKLADTSFEYTE